MNEGQTGNGGNTMAYGGASMSGGVSAGGSPVGGANPVMPGEAVNSAMTGSGANSMTYTGAPMGGVNSMAYGGAPMGGAQSPVMGQQNPMMVGRGSMMGQQSSMTNQSNPMVGQQNLVSSQQNPMMATGAVGGGMPGAGGYVGTPISSGTGDIVLDNSGGRKSKKWWIIGGLVAVVLVGVIVGVVMWPKGGVVSAKMTRQNWEEYYDLLMFGPNYDGNGELLNKIYAESIEDEDMDYMSHNEYYETYFDNLKSKLDAFYESGKGMVGGIDEYATMANIYIKYKTLGLIEDKVYKEYAEDGEQGAVGVFEIDDGDNVSTMEYYMNSYLRAKLALWQKYSENGCIVSRTIISDCVDRVDSREMDDIVSNRFGAVNSYFDNVFFGDFAEKTAAMNEEVKKV